MFLYCQPHSTAASYPSWTARERQSAPTEDSRVRLSEGRFEAQLAHFFVARVIDYSALLLRSIAALRHVGLKPMHALASPHCDNSASSCGDARKSARRTIFWHNTQTPHARHNAPRRRGGGCAHDDNPFASYYPYHHHELAGQLLLARRRTLLFYRHHHSKNHAAPSLTKRDEKATKRTNGGNKRDNNAPSMPGNNPAVLLRLLGVVFGGCAARGCCYSPRLGTSPTAHEAGASRRAAHGGTAATSSATSRETRRQPATPR